MLRSAEDTQTRHKELEGISMRVLVACEFSGTVRREFAGIGHDAWSCDLLDSEDNSNNHLKCNVIEILNDGWDLMIAHPPCTYLSVSGMHWTTRGKRDPKLTEDALEFVKLLMSANIPKIAIENPISVISTRIRKPDQIIQPWMFGHGETKATCLWLKNLPKLQPTNIVKEREQKMWKLPPSKDRWKLRSKTYQGIAKAMATQWGVK